MGAAASQLEVAQVDVGKGVYHRNGSVIVGHIDHVGVGVDADACRAWADSNRVENPVDCRGKVDSSVDYGDAVPLRLPGVGDVDPVSVWVDRYSCGQVSYSDVRRCDSCAADYRNCIVPAADSIDQVRVRVDRDGIGIQ